MASRSAMAMVEEFARTRDSARGFKRKIRPAVAIMIPKEDFRLMPAACIHWPLTDKQQFYEWIQRVQDTNSYVFLVGDTFDFARTHYRTFVGSYSGDESSRLGIDDMHMRDIQELAEILRPISARILGIVRGNHYHTFADGRDSEHVLSSILGVRYLGVEGCVRLDCGSQSIVFYLHHNGGGGGTTMGGDANALLRAAGVINPDVVLCAHTHRAYAFKDPQHEVSRTGDPTVIERDRAFMRCGCFKSQHEHLPESTGFIPDYRATAAYRPINTGWTELEVQFTETSRKFWVRF